MNLLFTGLSLSQTTVPLFKPMIIVAFIFGFLTCLAFCWKRLRESRQAFNVASELLDVANEKNAALAKRNAHLEEKISSIRCLTWRMKSQRKSELDGKAALPAADENSTRQLCGIVACAAIPFFQEVNDEQ